MNGQVRSRFASGAVLFAALASGCTDGDVSVERGTAYAAPAAETLPVPVDAFPSLAEWETLAAHVAARVDAVDARLRRVPNLTRAEQNLLRADVNAVQIARARALGISRDADPEPLLASGRLVQLPDSTAYWTVRELGFSSPYVTPETGAMLEELGRRFHTELERLELPAFRFQITSVLRTPENQTALRRGNPNASRTVSAHEFGTTVDVAYRRFSAPQTTDLQLTAAVPDQAAAVLRLLHDVTLEQVARDRGTELQAILGRVVKEMRDEGHLLVMMERQQTVYHMTLARR